jgi:hypothetical protein
VRVPVALRGRREPACRRRRDAHPRINASNLRESRTRGMLLNMT